MTKIKLTTEIKEVFKAISVTLPVDKEVFTDRLTMKGEDILLGDPEGMGMTREEIDPEKDYPITMPGFRVIEATRHYKRLCRAAKRSGVYGISRYVTRVGGDMKRVKKMLQSS